MKIWKSVGGFGLVSGLSVILFFSSVFVSPAQAQGDGYDFLTNLPAEMIHQVFENLSPKQVFATSRTSRVLKEIAQDHFKIRRARAMKRISGRFVKIPEAQLGEKTISAFEAISVVTRKDWEDFMILPPTHYVQGEGNWGWENCLNCPVTHVSIQDIDDLGNPVSGEIPTFLNYVNREAREQGENCIYSAGSAEQWQVALRGKTENQDNATYLTAKKKDSQGADILVGITEEQEASNYIWHSGNSNATIHPIQTKDPNALGLERPSVSLVTETIYSAENPEFGNTVLGAAFSDEISEALPHSKSGLQRSNPLVGFSMTRICQKSH